MPKVVQHHSENDGRRGKVLCHKDIARFAVARLFCFHQAVWLLLGDLLAFVVMTTILCFVYICDVDICDDIYS